VTEPDDSDETMATVTFRDATRTYPKSTLPAVNRLNLEAKDGEFLVLVGPSGCGKTTSLRMLAGLEHVDEGTILIDDDEVVKLPPRDRDIAMVFQNYALYPHMNVEANMGFALRMAKVPKREIAERVRTAARLLDLEEYLDRKPRQLSGGQRQRVAMGRAIVREPRVFLMDEPLSNLDAQLRVATRAEIAALQRRLGVTTLYVTHDQVEAMTMGHRVAVMRDGVLQQCAAPRVLYEQPANAFVAGFIGSPTMNMFNATVEDRGVSIGGSTLEVPGGVPLPGGSAVLVGLRPEALELSTSGLPGVVSLVEELGAEAFVYVELSEAAASAVDAGRKVIVRVPPNQAPRQGAAVCLAPKPGSMLFFNRESGDRVIMRAG
jgi:multiple sugar transport system ATP-binding protein